MLGHILSVQYIQCPYIHQNMKHALRILNKYCNVSSGFFFAGFFNRQKLFAATQEKFEWLLNSQTRVKGSARGYLYEIFDEK